MSTAVEESTALVPVAPGELASPLPAFRGPQMAEALVAYKELQGALDRSMPDQLMELDGKAFRKKGYWRAVSVAFNLNVEPIYEAREVHGIFEDGRENFGYVVTYRASSGNRSASGDGSCFAVEKARRFKCPHPEREGSKRTLHWPHDTCPDFDPGFQWRTLPAQATEHNIRSHAHTRAYNRAVSNLVGFGEVSYDELDDNEKHEEPRTVGNGHTPQAARPAMQAPQRKSGQPISEAQRRRMFAIAMNHGWSEDEYRAHIKHKGFDRDEEVTRDVYEAICGELEAGTKG